MNHHKLAVMSRAAYITATHAVNGVEAILSELDGTQVLAFRGTSFNFKDILRDLRGIPWYNHRLRAWVHRGFLTGAIGFFENTTIFHDYDPDKPLILTGHSLGGALAVVTAGVFVSRGHVPDAVVTFGCPAPGYGKGLRKLLSDVPETRYIYGVDAVPSHPWFGSHNRGATCIGEGDDRLRDHEINRYVNALSHS